MFPCPFNGVRYLKTGHPHGLSWFYATRVMDEDLIRVVKSAVVSLNLGEIGGNMGLFLGCSLLTICEFFDFIIHFLATRGRRQTHHSA